MSYTTPPSGGCGERIQEPTTGPDRSHVRQIDASAAYRMDFYLIHVAISVVGFKMSWTARSGTPGDRGSNLCLVREFSTATTSSATTRAIQWSHATSHADGGTGGSSG